MNDPSGPQIQLTVFDDRDTALDFATQRRMSCFRHNSTTPPLWLCVHETPGDLPTPTSWFAGGQVVYDTGLGDESQGALLMSLRFVVPAEQQLEFEQWYPEEHGPILIQEPDWLRVRLIRVDRANDATTHAVVHNLSGEHVLSSAVLEQARSTQAREHWAQQAWFRASQNDFFTKTTG